MKKIFSLLISLSVSIISFSQLSKGQKYLGGSLELGKNKGTNNVNPDQSRSSYFTITPRFGVGLNNNWIIGLAPGWTHLTGRATSGQGTSIYESKSRTDIYDFSVFLRKFYPFSDRAGFFTQVEGGVGKGVYESITKQNSILTSNTKYKTSNIDASIQPGLYFKISNKVLVESSFGGLGYAHQSRKATGSNFKEFSNAVNFNLGKTLALGVQYIF